MLFGEKLYVLNSFIVTRQYYTIIIAQYRVCQVKVKYLQSHSSLDFHRHSYTYYTTILSQTHSCIFNELPRRT